MRDKLKFLDGTELEPGVMFCVGSNYSKHAKEMGGSVPAEPVIFLKPPQAYLSDGGTVKLPEFSVLPHHEVELVVVIGRDCENVTRFDAHNYVAGFGIGIDVTLRDIQNDAKKEGKPWAVAKGFYTSAPISAIVPCKMIDSIHPDFKISLKVNGEIRQSANTSEMERTVQVLIEYLSKVFTLRKGDIIFTGTPEGVGKISPGDKLTAELEGFVNLNVNVE